MPENNCIYLLVRKQRSIQQGQEVCRLGEKNNGPNRVNFDDIGQ